MAFHSSLGSVRVASSGQEKKFLINKKIPDHNLH